MMTKGDTIIFTNDSLGFMRTTRVFIKDIRKYKTFRTYLTTQGLSRCLPSIESIEDGLSVYYKYFSKADEQKYGVLAVIW